MSDNIRNIVQQSMREKPQQILVGEVSSTETYKRSLGSGSE